MKPVDPPRQAFGTHVSCLSRVLLGLVLVFVWHLHHSSALAQMPGMTTSDLAGRWQALSINGREIPGGYLLLLELDGDGRMFMNVGMGREPGGRWSLVSVGGVAYLRQITPEGTFDSMLAIIGPDRFSLHSPEGDVLVFERMAGTWTERALPAQPESSIFEGQWTFVTYGGSSPFDDIGLYSFDGSGALQAEVAGAFAHGTWRELDRDGVDHLRVELNDEVFEAAFVASSADSITLISPTGNVFAMFRAP